MKNVLALAALFVAPVLLGAAPAQSADLTLDLATTTPGGRIAVAVHRDAASLRRGEGAILTAMVERTGPTTRAVITGLPRAAMRWRPFMTGTGTGR